MKKLVLFFAILTLMAGCIVVHAPRGSGIGYVFYYEKPIPLTSPVPHHSLGQYRR